MRLLIAAVGRLKAGPDRELAERYRERAAKAGKPIGLRGVDIKEITESRAGGASARIAEEGAALSSIMAGDGVRVALDSRGTPLTSEVFADRIGQWRDGGTGVLYFAIGGADGLAEDVRKRATLVLSFGSATWPHQLVRIMLLEQVYRAVTLLSGHPYHRP